MEESSASAPRWTLRLTTLHRSVEHLERFCALKEPNELEQVGIVKLFEIALELAWKTLQDLLRYRGYTDVAGPRPVLVRAAEDGILPDATVWLRMLQSRNLTAHTYNRATLDQILGALREEYLPAFTALVARLESMRKS